MCSDGRCRLRLSCTVGQTTDTPCDHSNALFVTRTIPQVPPEALDLQSVPQGFEVPWWEVVDVTKLDVSRCACHLG